MPLFKAKRRFEVRYRAAPAWEVGERTAEHRPGEHYPDDWADKVLDIRPVVSDLPNLRQMADKTRPVIELELSAEQLAGIRSRELKIENGELVSVNVDDRWGRVAGIFRERGKDPATWEAESKAAFVAAEQTNTLRESQYEADVADYDERYAKAFLAGDPLPDKPVAAERLEPRDDFHEEASRIARTLPAPDVHTGTGNYFTKETPAHNDDTQSGAPAGQVITLTTGGLGTSDAFIGGYITNATRAETRSIVSHNDGDATLEGDLTNWLDTDDLDIYDAWSSIQGAADQLWTDQGAGSFPAIQYLRVFAGTYDENVTPNTSLRPLYGRSLIIEGDPTDDRANIVVQPAGGTYVFYLLCLGGAVLRHLTVDGTNVSSFAVYARTNLANIECRDLQITGASNYALQTVIKADVVGCNIVATGSGGIFVTTRDSIVTECTVKQTGARGTTHGIRCGHGIVESCTIRGFRDGFYVEYRDGDLFRNCDIYDCTYGWYFDSNSGCSRKMIQNCIVHTVTDVIRNLPAGNWPDEAGGTTGHSFTLRNNCFYTYTNFASDGTTPKSYAQFTAFDRVDASGDLDATDPLLTAPGSDDFSLQAASSCRFAGHGSGVVTDVNGVALDPYHPDIGAWSSGLASSTTIAITGATTSVSTVTVAITVTVATYVNARLIDNAGAVVDEQSRTGSGDIALTLSAAPRHFVMVWASNGAGDVIDEPVMHSATVFVTPAASATFNTIRSLLDQALDEYQGSDVAYENSEYAPIRGTGYLRPTFMPGESEQAALGDDGENRLVGVYQISVFEPPGEGVGPAETIAEGLVAAFKRGSTFNTGDVTVRVQKAWRGVAVQEKDWYHVPVSVTWFAYVAN